MKVPTPHPPSVAPDPPGSDSHLERLRDAQLEQLQSAWIRFGPEDARTVDALEVLGVTLSDLGDVERERIVRQQTLDVCAELLGARHPRTVRAAWNFFRAQLRRGEHDAALEVYRDRLASLATRGDHELDAETRRIRDWLEGWAELLDEERAPSP